MQVFEDKQDLGIDFVVENTYNVCIEAKLGLTNESNTAPISHFAHCGLH